jgi:hypothetical protein
MNDKTKQTKKKYAKPELAVIDLVGESVLGSCMKNSLHSEMVGNCETTYCKFK